MEDYKELIAELRELANNPKIYLSLCKAFKVAVDSIEQLVKERDAAIEDLRGQCDYCKYLKHAYCFDSNCDTSNWEWRGVQE